MEYCRVKKNTEVFNKLNSKVYVIEDENGTAREVDAVTKEILPSGDQVVITEANCICFRTIKDAEPTKPEGYSVKDGKLVRNGSEVTQQGEIEVISILGAFINGEIVLAVKTPLYPNMVALYLYNPSRDKFTDLRITVYAVEDISSLYSSDTQLYLMSNKTQDRQIDGVSYSAVLDYGVIRLSVEGPRDRVEVDILLTVNDGIDLPYLSLDGIEMMPNNSTLVCNYTKEIVDVYETDDDGDEIPVPVLRDNELKGYVLIEGSHVMVIPNVTSLTQAASAVYSSWLGKTLLFTDDLIFVNAYKIGPAAAVSAVINSGCNILIDECDRGDVRKYIFADSNYNNITLRVTKTPDRGYIYENE